MKCIDIYKQYFSASCVYDEIERKGVVVTCTATSDCGMIGYEVAVNFFPHREEDDFSITYDAYLSKQIYYGKGRRSKKREMQLLSSIQEEANELASQLKGVIDWEKALNM